MSSLFSKSITLRRELKITDEEFKQLRDFIYDQSGIYVADNRKYLLENRLGNRVRELNLKDFGEYYYFLRYDPGKRQELSKLFEVVTTNETSFFRNPPQLKVFQEQVLAEVIAQQRKKGDKRLNIWSAGCSTGEEPYTIAMLLETVKKSHPGIDFKYFVLGTDISRRVIEKARTAIYSTYQIQHIPMEIKHQSLLKSRDSSKGLFKVAPEVREHVRFRQLNFLDADFQLRDHFDIIFFRNVQIYFQPDDRKSIVSKILSYLKNGGYIIFGYAENITDLEMDLEHLDKCIFRKNQYGK